MYKHARGKDVVARGGSKFRLRPFEPRTKPDTRKWWFPVIKQAAETGTTLRQHTSRKPPEWLKDELEQRSWLGWLSAVNRKTGQIAKKP
jgi:hypothetical protein